MIGLDFPVKPEWVHDVLQLWQPGQPISDLIQASLSHTMMELGGEKSRRKSLTIILRCFVPAEGPRNRRRALSPNVWAEHVRAYPLTTLAPAYLFHLITQSEVAMGISRFLSRRRASGNTLGTGEVKRQIIAQYGQRKVVTNTASAFLRTLQYFDVLEAQSHAGKYGFRQPLSVDRQAFPLLVWSWWVKRGSPQIDLDAFEAESIQAFLFTERFDSHWQAFQPALWVLDERIEGSRATLKHGDDVTLQHDLISLLDNHPWKGYA